MKNPKNCLTCKYEPDWSEWSIGEYPRQHGKCKYVVDWPKLPYVFVVHTRSLARYSDDSGLPPQCKCWSAKR